MIPSPPPADDADLHAYADGRLSAERVPIVEARLAADPTARAQVQQLAGSERGYRPAVRPRGRAQPAASPADRTVCSASTGEA